MEQPGERIGGTTWGQEIAAFRSVRARERGRSVKWASGARPGAKQAQGSISEAQIGASKSQESVQFGFASEVEQ